MMRRESTTPFGGHASVAGKFWEDVALAWRVKAAGQRIWFISGKGLVRVRMYAVPGDVAGLGQKILSLMGGTPSARFPARWSPTSLGFRSC